MPQIGSPMFEAYTRTLRRVYWAEFIDSQLSATRNASFKASLVPDDSPAAVPLAPAYEYHRHRGSADGDR